MRGIAAALNARGVRTARGGTWHQSNLRNLLLRAARRRHPNHQRLNCHRTTPTARLAAEQQAGDLGISRPLAMLARQGRKTPWT
jgi:hypothetical protein